LELGETRTLTGQRFVCVGWVPHINRNGDPTVLALWGTNCAECGGATQFALAMDREKWEPSRRCAEHKRPGVRAHA
jgi:hypothetical protein